MANKVSPTGSPVSEDFERETRFVVLSYLGLVPANVFNESFGSQGTSSDEALAESQGSSGIRNLSPSKHLSSLPAFSLEQKIDRLTDSGGEEDSYYLENAKGKICEDSIDVANVDIRQSLNDHLKQQIETSELDEMRPFHRYRKNVDRLVRQSSDAKSDSSKIHDDQPKKRLSRGYSFAQRPNSIPLRPHMLIDDELGSPQMFRRIDSKVSECSEVTIPVSVVSERSSYVDVQQIEVDTYVKSNILPTAAAPLKKELESELKDLRDEIEKQGKQII